MDPLSREEEEDFKTMCRRCSSERLAQIIAHEEGHAANSTGLAKMRAQAFACIARSMAGVMKKEREFVAR
jgi:hypothetical protein